LGFADWLLDALSVYHEMECRGVANVIGAPDDRQAPLAGGGFKPRSVDK